MVLEGASGSIDSTNDSLANNDDPSFSPATSSKPYNPPAASKTLLFGARLEDLPQTFLVRSVSPQILTRACNKSMIGFSNIIQRPLTPNEATAISQHAAQAAGSSLYGYVPGVIGGLYRTWATRDTFKFPFFSTKGPRRFNPNFAMGVVGGPLPRIYWHVLRGSLYVSIGSYLTEWVAATYAIGYMQVAMTRDKRLEVVLKEMLQVVKEKTDGARRRQSSGAGAVSDGGDWKASDSSAAAQDGFVEDGASGVSSQQISEQEAQELGRGGSGSRRQVWRGPKASSSVGKREESVFDLGDSSSSDSGTGGKSASEALGWGAIRQQSRKGAEPSKAGSNSEESFAFSSADEESKLAKAEAQKDFDERVERERQGGDFEGRSKRSGGWS